MQKVVAWARHRVFVSGVDKSLHDLVNSSQRGGIPARQSGRRGIEPHGELICEAVHIPTSRMTVCEQ
jgi:hypothetical protein